MTGTLYIVGTPVGNLEDVTLRAVKVLSDVDIVLAEDTRVTKKLLNFFDDPNFQFSISNFQSNKDSQQPITHNPQLISYHQHSDERKKLEILNYLNGGKNVALVTDAGTPGISDPGNELIEYLLGYVPDLKIVPIPGVSAVTTALSICSFNVNKFTFIGFLPKKKINKLLKSLKLLNQPIVFFESPFRILKTLGLIRETFGENARIFIAQELTKMHERVVRGNITQVIIALEAQEKAMGRIKGEIVVILEP